MGLETKITISLPAEVVADLETAVAEGRFASMDAAIAEAVDEIWYRDFEERVGRERLATLLQEGADSGPSVDGEQVFERLIAKYERMARERG